MPWRGTMVRNLEKLGLSLLTAALMFLVFNYLHLAWIGFLALIPLIVLHLHPRYDARFYWLIPGWFLFELWKFHGTAHAYGAFVPFLLAFCFVLPVLMFPLVLRFVWRRTRVPLVLLVPLVWTCVEWIRIYYTVGNFAHWALGSNLFVYLQMVQIADLLGIYGLAILSAAVNGALAEVILGWRPGRRWAGLGDRRMLSGLAVAGGLLAACWIYGGVRLEQGRHTISEGPRVALLQPNLKHRVEYAYEVHQRHFQLTLQHIEPGSADLVAWPENAIMDLVDREGTYYLGEIRELTRTIRAPLLVGGFGWDTDAQDTTNGVWYVLPSGEVAGRYDKQILAPWTEYLPLEGIIRFLSPLYRGYHSLAMSVLGRLPSGVRGSGPVAFPLETPEGTFHFGLMTCSENVIPDISRESVRAGARFLLNPTSEGNLGRQVYYNTWANCVIRAVENRVGVVRVGNNGISGFIGPDGQGYAEVRGPQGELWLVRGTSTACVKVDERSPTFFTRHGRVIGILFPVATVLMMIGALAGTRRGRSRRPGVP